MNAITNFGEQFAVKTLRKFYQRAITPAITNSDYEGEIRKAGDRVNILMFLSDITLTDYVAGTDMDTEAIVDSESVLVVEKRKYYNFPIDRLEDLFTYSEDIDDTLVENANKVLERTVDQYVLEFAQFAKAGSWVGINLRMVGDGADTGASIATTATGGTVTISAGATLGGNVATIENPADGNLYLGGFTTPEDIGRPIRLTSGVGWATEWYRITGVTDTQNATVENWDGATEGSDIPVGDILRGLGGSLVLTGGAQNTDGKVTTENGWGFEIQAAIGTTINASNIFDHLTELGEKLDENEIPDEDRHVTVPAIGKKILFQASELQPSGVEAIYRETIINRKVARISGFDVHMATGIRISTRFDHVTSSGAGASTITAAGTSRHQILANHRSYITFAYKWQESRVIDAEAQFAKKYQGLHLWGAKVPELRRKSGALLFGSF